SRRLSWGRKAIVAESLDQEQVHAPVEQPRELWPEEAEDAASRSKAKSYFQQHPAAKWVLLVLVLALIGAGIWLWHYYGARESTDDAQVDAHIAPVSARVSGTVNKVLV